MSLEMQDQWFLGAGSLVGSLQHHDLTPWEDDADVVVHLRYRPRIQEALNNFSLSLERTRKTAEISPFFLLSPALGLAIYRHLLLQRRWLLIGRGVRLKHP
ncbi:unnamed protein product [Taenia asiatica]|uniref:Lipopolysaccharide cholinephosphotransferase n=1 Tax=Taenia asiatica TaxID=60517 RepID=A0A0R3VZ48_TAEAS|nr:unnamed protein product [Taenia asiatica]